MESITTEKSYQAALSALRDLPAYIDRTVPDEEANQAEELLTAILAYEEIYYSTTPPCAPPRRISLITNPIFTLPAAATPTYPHAPGSPRRSKAPAAQE